MAIIDHGKWVRYDRPADTPDIIPHNVVFVRREGDGKDWYLHVYGRLIGDPQKPTPKLDLKTMLPLPADQQPPPYKSAFQPDSVKCAAIYRKDSGVHIIGAATRDASAIFPVNQYVFEITDHKGRDPQQDLGGKAYDPKTKKITDPPKLEPTGPIVDLLKRIEALEKAQR